jgi:hypothetical protein
MFLLYHSEGCNICEMVLHECYVNYLHTTTCSGMLGHHSLDQVTHLLEDEGRMERQPLHGALYARLRGFAS